MRVKCIFLVSALVLASPAALSQINLVQAQASMGLSSEVGESIVGLWDYKYGKPLRDSESCQPNPVTITCAGGAWLTTTGYTTPGQVSSTVSWTNIFGNVYASSGAYAQSSSSWSFNGTPFVISPNASVQANISTGAPVGGRISNLYAITPSDQGPSDRLATTVVVSCTVGCSMTVMGLTATATDSENANCAGQCTAITEVSWTIQVIQGGNIIATYSSASYENGEGANFGPVNIPGGATVQVSWSVYASASGTGWNLSASATDSVSGIIYITSP